MTEVAQASGRKGPTLETLVDLVSAGGKLRDLAKAGTRMHRLVDFYDPPVGYIGRLRTLRALSDLTIGDIRLTSICRPLAKWRPYIDTVLAAPDKFAKGLDLVGSQRSSFLADSGRDPLKGTALKRHGLEGLLWPALDPSEKYYSEYLMLQGQMLIAQVSILTVEFAVARGTAAGVPDQDIYPYIYGPCLRARDFSKADWSEALGRLPGVSPPDSGLPNPMDPVQYRQALDSLVEESRHADGQKFCGVGKEDFRETLGSISAFIGRGIIGRKYRKRKHDGNGQTDRRPVSVTTRTVGADGSSSTESAAAEIVTRTRGTSEEREELDQSGECPEDHLPRRQIILSAGGPRVAEHVRAAYDRANQLLPNRNEEPHPRQFDRLCSAMYPQRWCSFTYRKDRFELLAWTQTIFWLGCSPTQATGLMVGLPQTPLPTNFDFFLRLGDMEDSETESEFASRTLVRAIEPHYVTGYVPIDGERPRENCFEIADLGKLADSVRDMLAFARDRDDLPNIREQAVKIFPESEETYVKRLSDFIESAKLGFRISANELGKVLFQRAKEVGDIVSADLITCKDHHLADVRRWYFTPRIEHLRGVHERATSSVLADMGFGAWQKELETLRLPRDERYVGSRRCVELDFIEQAVMKLRDIVEEVVAVRTDHDRRREFALKHNALTVLAVWAIDICIGKRGTTHLYLHWSQYDGKTGFGSIIEKGKARAFRLCESGLGIAGKYDQYIDSLSDFGLPRLSHTVPCYFLEVADQKLQPVPVTPASIKKFLSGLFRFDPNWARRLVKTTALEQGLPAIYTDNYCGHAFRGEERYHPYGSFDPVPYFQTMAEFTEHTLQKIGLTPDSFNPRAVEPCS
jgi:hypothetical protein